MFSILKKVIKNIDTWMSENKFNDHLKYSILNKITFIWYMCPQGWSEYESFTSYAKKKVGERVHCQQKCFCFNFQWLYVACFSKKMAKERGSLRLLGPMPMRVFGIIA